MNNASNRDIGTLSPWAMPDLDDRPWAAYAACRHAEPDLFFPGSKGDSCVLGCGVWVGEILLNR